MDWQTHCYELLGYFIQYFKPVPIQVIQHLTITMWNKILNFFSNTWTTQYTLTTQKSIIVFLLQHLFFTTMYRLGLVSITLVSGKYQQNKKLEMTTKILLGWGPERSMLHLHAFNIQGTMLQQKRNFPFVAYITLKKKTCICNTVYLLQQGFLARRWHPSSHMKYHF